MIAMPANEQVLTSIKKTKEEPAIKSVDFKTIGLM
jgi:hypothetical protein